MMQCHCDYDPPEFHSAAIRTARKPHRCEECNYRIQPGEPYERVAGKWEGDFSSFSICAQCRDLRQWVQNNIPCFCWSYSAMLEDAEECVREACRYAPDETQGVLFGFLRRRHAITLRNRKARAS